MLKKLTCYNPVDPNNSNKSYYNFYYQSENVSHTSKEIISSLENTAKNNNQYDFYSNSYDIDFPVVSTDFFGTQQNTISISYSNKILKKKL